MELREEVVVDWLLVGGFDGRLDLGRVKIFVWPPVESVRCEDRAKIRSSCGH